MNIKVDQEKLDKLKKIARINRTPNQSDQEIQLQNMEKAISQIQLTTSHVKSELDKLVDRVVIHKEELSTDFSKQLTDQSESKNLMQTGLGGLNKENEARKQQLDKITEDLSSLGHQMMLYQKLDAKLDFMQSGLGELNKENEARKEQLERIMEDLSTSNRQMELYQSLETKLEALTMENEERKEHLNQQFVQISASLKELSEQNKPVTLQKSRSLVNPPNKKN